MEKNSCTPINPKKYSCYGLKKIHTRNLITKKNSYCSKIPHSPHNFSNGPSLNITGSEKTDLSTSIVIVSPIKSTLFTTPAQARLIQVLFFNVAFHYLCYRAIQ